MGYSQIIASSPGISIVQEALRNYPERQLQAIRSAINDTLQRSKRPLAGELAEEINLGKTKISQRIAITGRPTKDSLSGELTISHAPIRMEEYKPKWTRAGGVTVTTIKGEGPRTFTHGFRATMKSGHRGFFLRQKLSVMGASTTAANLVKLGFPEWEARQAMQSAGELAGRGIRYQKRAAAGGNFPSVSPSGYAGRLPIADIMGPSVVSAIEHKPELLDRGVEDLERRFLERLMSKLDWQLDAIFRNGRA